SCVASPQNKSCVRQPPLVLGRRATGRAREALAGPLPSPVSLWAQATAEGEEHAARRADAPAHAYRPKSTTQGLTRGALAVPAGIPYEAIYTELAGGFPKPASPRSGSIRWPDAPPL